MVTPLCLSPGIIPVGVATEFIFRPSTVLFKFRNRSKKDHTSSPTMPNHPLMIPPASRNSSASPSNTAQGYLRRSFLRDLAFFVFGMATNTIFMSSVSESFCLRQSLQLSQQMEDMMVIMQENSPVMRMDKLIDKSKQSSDCSTSKGNITSMLLDLWERVPEPTDATRPANQASLVSFVPARRPRPKHDVVLITQAGVSKFRNILLQVRWWGGPADIAMFFKSKNEILLFEDFIEANKAALENVTFHAMVEKSDDLPYPNNLVRNLVLDNLREDYYVAMDVDFITNKGAYADMYDLIHRKSQEVKRRLQAREIFVMPAFSLLAPKGKTSPTEDMLPKDKKELRDLKFQRKLTVFRPGGHPHKPTNYTRFFYGSNVGGKTFYELKYDGCGTYEPYVLGYRHGAPRYWNELRSGYMNKVSFFKEMSRDGFKYNMLFDFWVVHMDHPYPAQDKKDAYVEYNKPYWQEFALYLRKWYPLLPCMLEWENELTRNKTLAEMKNKMEAYYV